MESIFESWTKVIFWYPGFQTLDIILGQFQVLNLAPAMT
jgi:hypothetical protein